MIERISSINNFGSFDGYRHSGDLPDFTKKNILYGWNYSGKTTISRIFDSLKRRALHPDYSASTFNIKVAGGKIISSDNIASADINIEVFNSDFIRDNLHWDCDEASDGIAFDVGEDVYGYRSKKDDNVKKILELNANKDQHRGAVSTFNDFDTTIFSKWARAIRSDIFNNAITFNKTHLQQIVSSIKDSAQSYIMTPEKLETVKSQAVQVVETSKVVAIDYILSYQCLRHKVSELLARNPQRGELIKHLDNSNLYNWVKQGLDLQGSTKTDECPFCGGELTDERLSKLCAFFSNEEAQLKQDINNTINAINEEIAATINLSFNRSVNDYMSKVQAKFLVHYGTLLDSQNSYIKLLNRLIDQLNVKLSGNIFNIICIDNDIPQEESVFSSWIINHNNIVAENNRAVDSFSGEKLNAITQVKNHYVASYIVESDYINIESQSIKASTQIELLDKKIKELEVENLDLQTKLESIVAGQEELNRFISTFLGSDDIKVEITDDKKFSLKRGDSIAKNLSDGEKMAIAFAYYLVRLEALHSKKELINTIVFIDDPISSLDVNHIAQVYSLINSFFFRKGIDESKPNRVVPCFEQLFISTHNFEFFSFLRDSKYITQIKKNSEGYKIKEHNYYFVKRKNDGKSTITKLPSCISKYKSEYIYLFSVIYKYYQSLESDDTDYDDILLIPNSIRRFIEIYSLMKLPHVSDSVESRVAELFGDINEYKSLNHFSHFTTFEKVAHHDDTIAILPNATNELISLLSKDLSHFESLKKAIGC